MYCQLGVLFVIIHYALFRLKRSILFFVNHLWKIFFEAVIDHLLDEAMSDMKIYLVEPRNMRRGEAESHILGEINKSSYPTNRRI